MLPSIIIIHNNRPIANWADNVYPIKFRFLILFLRFLSLSVEILAQQLLIGVEIHL